ncbi:MAG TPA: hypothetical protein VGF50_12525 [Caulobacteraceae bacterium]|jgi:hypothetical protein
MSRTIIAATAAVTCMCGQAVAAPALGPVTDYRASAADRADPVTVLTARRPVRREVKHVATTWGGYLFDYLNVAADCQPTDAVVTLVRAPEHGELIVGQTSVPATRSLRSALRKGDPRRACAELLVQQGFYRPEYGYVGRDRMVVGFQAGDAYFTDAIGVVVRPAANPNPLRPHH